MKQHQRSRTIASRANLPDRGQLRGVITLVQEDRFRLQDELGRGYLLTLGRRNGLGLTELHRCCAQGSTVDVEYRGTPDMGAIALSIRHTIGV